MSFLSKCLASAAHNSRIQLSCNYTEGVFSPFRFEDSLFQEPYYIKRKLASPANSPDAKFQNYSGKFPTWQIIRNLFCTCVLISLFVNKMPAIYIMKNEKKIPIIF